jgi:hypothetical protein
MERWYPPTNLHGVRTKNISALSAVRTVYLTRHILQAVTFFLRPPLPNPTQENRCRWLTQFRMRQTSACMQLSSQVRTTSGHRYFSAGLFCVLCLPTPYKDAVCLLFLKDIHNPRNGSRAERIRRQNQRKQIKYIKNRRNRLHQTNDYIQLRKW